MHENLTYKMEVTIANPSSEETETYTAKWEFHQKENDYGNKWWAKMKPLDNFKFVGDMVFDLRYTPFTPDKTISFITDWAERLWNGKEGAWEVKDIEIEKSPNLELGQER